MSPILKTLLLVCAVVAAASAEDSKCSCGVFPPSTAATTTGTPILSKHPDFPINCAVDGKEKCAKMCMAIAEAAKENAPKLLCEAAGTTTEPLAPLIYSKSCGQTEWSNTGLVPKITVCCAENAPVPC